MMYRLCGGSSRRERQLEGQKYILSFFAFLLLFPTRSSSGQGARRHCSQLYCLTTIGFANWPHTGLGLNG